MNSSDRRMILSDWRKILSTAFCLCYCTPQTPGPYYQLMWGLWILSTRSVWDSCLESNGRLQPSLKWWTIQQTGLTSLSHISYPVDASRYLSMWLDLTTGLHLVVHGTSGSTSYETTPQSDWELWRRAVDRRHGGATTQRPSPATETWWWWWWWWWNTLTVSAATFATFLCSWTQFFFVVFKVVMQLVLYVGDWSCVNGRWQFSLLQNRHPSTDRQKFVMGD